MPSCRAQDRAASRSLLCSRKERSVPRPPLPPSRTPLPHAHQLDPLQRDHTIDEDRVSLVTVARPRRDSTPAASPLATVAQIDSSEPIAIARASDASTDASTSAPASIHEKAPLSLPAPPTPPARLVPRLVGVRVLKSAIVVVKVSAVHLCGHGARTDFVWCRCFR